MRPALILSTLVLSSLLARAGDLEGKVSAPRVKTLRDVVVYLDGKGLPAASTPTEGAVVDQKNIRFVPKVLPVVMGTTVRFLNSDDTAHNVTVRTEAGSTTTLGTYGKGEEKSLAFPEPGVVELLCNVHQEMYGVVLVLRNAFFTRPADDGTFVLKDVPEGEHEIVAFYPDIDPLRQKVTVGKHGVVHVDLSLR
ncbi:MAG: plastocyanin/azurin family copper-binding protein [Acidobacteriota bacterium]